MASAVLLVCSRCGCQVRECSAHCTMGGAVHVSTEKHLCNPGMAWALRKRPDLWDVPWMFARVKRVEVDSQENWPIRKKRR